MRALSRILIVVGLLVVFAFPGGRSHSELVLRAHGWSRHPLPRRSGPTASALPIMRRAAAQGRGEVPALRDLALR